MMMKLKGAFLALSVFLMVGTFLSKSAHAECKEGEKRTTTTGAIFTCDTSQPSLASLGEVWRDPDEVIWGDIVKNADGTRFYANQNDAAKICNSYGAYLPSYQQFDRLREFLGAKRRDTHIPPEGYEAQILPNLSNSWFWSSTFNVNLDNTAFFFRGSDGVISYDSFLNLGSIRCIVSR